MKKMIITFFILLFIGLNVNCFAVTEFVCTCNKTGEDFNTITLWEDCMDAATDLTDGTVKTGNYDGQVGVNISSGAAVTWDAGGSNGTLIYMTGTQYLIDVLGGTLEDNDTISDGGESSFDIAGSPDSAILTLECYNDDGNLSENGIVIDGFTTSATNYCKITVPAGERHNGIAGTGFCIDGGGINTSVIVVYDNYVRIEWLEIKNWGNNNSAFAILIDYAIERACTVKNLIIHGSGGTMDEGIRIFDSWNNKIYNCIVYDCGRGFTVRSVVSTYNNYFYNCSYYGQGAGTKSGFSKWASTITCTNCCSFNGDPDFQDIVASAGSIVLNNCISDDSTADDFLGSNNLVDKVATNNYTNVTGGSEDLHLKAGADCIDVGQDLSGTFTDDIDGVTRSGTWDVGADEYVAGGGGGGGDGGPHIYIFSSVRSCAIYGEYNVIASNGDNIIAANGDNLVAN